MHVRHRWNGWREDGALRFTTPAGEVVVQPQATVLALGGASWPQLGSDAAWVEWLGSRGVYVAPLKPANCGFDAAWSDHFLDKFEGHPLKNVALTFADHTARGECVITKTGLEGGPVYTLSSALVAAQGKGEDTTIAIDLKPDLGLDTVTERLAKPRGKKSWATHLKRTLGISGAAAGLLREGTDKDIFKGPARLAATIKALPVRLTRPRPIAEAISSSGGIAWNQVDAGLQLSALPGVYVAGEMLDWDAPTGGYLLSACLATGRWAGEAIAKALHGDP